jgi:carboxylesterase type B
MPAALIAMVCPQPQVTWAGHDLDRTSEDCLTLHVWTPRAAVGAHLPVLVWFHGGGYTAGAGPQSTYEGSKLARRGVVIVTVNYRAGDDRTARHGLFQKAIFESGAALGLPGVVDAGLGLAEAAGTAFARALSVQTVRCPWRRCWKPSRRV